MNKLLKNKEFQIKIATIFIAFILITPQLFSNNGITLFIDSTFHLNRFYDTYMQIKDHNFQPFIMMYGFDSIGRYINSLYGPLLSYFCGLMLYLLHSYHNFQLTFNFIILLCAGLSTNYMLKVGRIKTKFRLYGIITYMVSFPVMCWIINSKFMGVGAAIMPFVIATGIRMVLVPDRPVKITEMVFAMVLVIQVHVLSAVIGTCYLMLTFIYALLNKKTNKWILWKNSIVSAILTIVLTMNVWLVYLVLSTQNKLLNPFPYDPYNHAVRWLNSSENVMASLIFICFCVILFFIFKNNFDRSINFLGWIGVITIAISSGIFPWGTVFHLVKGVSILQFPSRLSPVGFLLIIFVGLYSLQYWNLAASEEKIVLITTKTIVLMEIMQCITLFTNAIGQWEQPIVHLNAGYYVKLKHGDYVLQKSFQSKDLGSPWNVIQKSVEDYLPATKQTSTWTNPNATVSVKHSNNKKMSDQYVNVYLNDKKFHKKVKNGHIIISWKQNNNEEITIPIAHYKGTTYEINGKKVESRNVKTGKSGSSIIYGEKGTNKAIIGYKFKI